MELEANVDYDGGQMSGIYVYEKYNYDNGIFIERQEVANAIFDYVRKRKMIRNRKKEDDME